MDELLAADEPPVRQLDESPDDVALYAEYRRLVAEQAAVRRVGTLVARGVEPSEVVGAVAEEMRRCVGAFTAGLWRFETSDEITLVAAACPSCCACQVACRYSHADRRKHPRTRWCSAPASPRG